MTLTIDALLPLPIHTLLYFDRPLAWLAYRDELRVLILEVDENFDSERNLWTYEWVEYLLQPDDVRELAHGITQPGRTPYNALFDRLTAFWLRATGTPRQALVCTRTPITPEQREQARFTEHSGSEALEPGWLTEGLEPGWEEPFMAGTATPPPPT